MLHPTKSGTSTPKRAATILPFPIIKGEASKPARKAITRSKPTVRVKYPSLKTNAVIECESALEAKAAAYIDLSHPVESFRSQPFTVELDVDGEVRAYTPDFEVNLLTGEMLVIEVKPLAKFLSPEVNRKLRAAHHYFLSKGVRFLVLTDDELGKVEFYNNLKLLRYYASETIDHKKRVSARSLISECAYVKFKELEEVGFSKAEIYSLIASNAIHADLNLPLDPESPLTLPEENSYEKCLFTGRSALDLG